MYHIDICIADCERLIEVDELKEALELIKFLNTPESKSYQKLTTYTKADLNALEGWVESCNQLILTCTFKLNQSFEEQQKIRPDSSSDNSKTLYDLENLRDQLAKFKIK